MKITFIGAGKVGRSFGYYLKNNGFDIVGYFSKSRQSQELAAGETSSRSLNEIEVVNEADVIFITTPDSEIEKVCEYFSSRVYFNSGHSVVHMSGGLSSEVLKSAGSQGASIFSLHPLQSFAQVDKAVEDLKNTFFTLEGKGDKSRILSLLEGINNRYVEIYPEKKALYHAAASIASNYLVALANISLKLLQECGFSRAQAREVAGTLMGGTIKNIEDYDTVEALTGPIARGDNYTVEKHIKVLKEQGYDDILDVYRLLGLETVGVAERKGLNTEKARELNQILKVENTENKEAGN